MILLHCLYKQDILIGVYIFKTRLFKYFKWIHLCINYYIETNTLIFNRFKICK